MDALDDAECGVGLLELLADHRERDVVHPATTPAECTGRPEALLAHPGEDLAVDLALRIPLADVRVDLRLAELPNGLLHKPVLIGRPKVDHAPILGTRQAPESAPRGRSGRRAERWEQSLMARPVGRRRRAGPGARRRWLAHEDATAPADGRRFVLRAVQPPAV